MDRSDGSRRGFLAGLGGAAAGLAGCGAVPSVTENRPPRLGWVHVANASPGAHTVHLTVERDGELVYWASHRLDGNPGEETDAPSVHLEGRDWMDTRGEWRLRARVDDAQEWSAAASGDRTDSCVAFDVAYDAEDPAGRRLDVYVVGCR